MRVGNKEGGGGRRDYRVRIVIVNYINNFGF